MYVPEIAAGIYDPYEIDANATVQRLMSEPKPVTNFLSSLKKLIAERPEDQQEIATGIIIKKFKVAEVDSLNEVQAEKVCNGWEAFMALPEFNEAPQS